MTDTKIKTEVHCECGNTFGGWYLWSHSDFIVRCKNCESIYRIELTCEEIE